MTAIRVPLLDLKAQYAPLRDEIRAAMDRVCDAQQFILGPEVQALEEEVARFSGAKFAIGVSSGTDALLAALMAAGVGPGDDVVTTPYSFFATAGTVSRLGARPVFVDIERDSFNIDSGRVASSLTPRTKAILPVHLFGRCADLDPILDAAAPRGIPVIEDAAQAIGAIDGRKRQAGTVGRMGCFSFFPTKNLGGFGDGGLITTNEAGLDDSLKMLRVHGMKPKYHHKIVGGNFRLDALQAAILRVKLKRLSAWSEGRRANAERYRRLLGGRGLDGRVGLPGDVPQPPAGPPLDRRDRDGNLLSGAAASPGVLLRPGASQGRFPQRGSGRGGLARSAHLSRAQRGAAARRRGLDRVLLREMSQTSPLRAVSRGRYTL
jgi:dTDP-4-amino-4,6-dideoxygalactose transaminase